MKFIKCSKENEIDNQIIEINYILFNKYFTFNNKILNNVNKLLFKYKNKYKIGIHYRSIDDVINNDYTDWNYLNKLNNKLKEICNNKKCEFVLSSFSNNFSLSFKEINKNTFIYKSYLKSKHLTKSKINKEDNEKILGDLISVSKCDYLLLSKRSTYSLLMLYSGGYINYNKCIIKNYSFNEDNNYFDHLEYWWNNNKKC